MQKMNSVVVEEDISLTNSDENNSTKFEKIEVTATKLISADGAIYFLDENGLYYILTTSKTVAVYKDVKNTKYVHLHPTIKIPDTIIVDDNTYTVTCISPSAFEGNMTIENVTIPSSITDITEAFYHCHFLRSVTILEGIHVICDYAFYCCSCLTYVKIPSSVTSIGVSAFSGCKSLVSVVVPEGVVAIASGAFRDCKSIILPASLKEIGYSALASCIKIYCAATSVPNGFRESIVMFYNFNRGTIYVSVPQISIFSFRLELYDSIDVSFVINGENA